MGKFEPARNLLMKVKEIAFVGKGQKPANKKTVFMLKTENDETEARYRAHTQEESMELNDKQVGDIAAKVVELIKAAPAAAPDKKIPAPTDGNPHPAAKPHASTDDTAAAAPVATGAHKPAPGASETPAHPAAMREHINALKDMMPVGANEDNEMTEDEAIAQMESALKLFETAHEVVTKCHKTRVEKGVTLKPATADETNVDTKKEPDAAAAQNSSDTLELDDEDEVNLKEAIKSEAEKCFKEAGIDEE